VPQEAIIGIVYVVASALAILVADRTPRGRRGDQRHPRGQPALGDLAHDRGPRRHLRLIGLFHWLLRHRCLTISFHPEIAWAQGWDVRWWDPLFYLSLGIVITFSVPIAGVLLVLSFLVVRAAVASQFTRRQPALAVISRGARADTTLEPVAAEHG
jgi:zinc/manganese transport system permease protein